jgi:hypothetical protein
VLTSAVKRTVLNPGRHKSCGFRMPSMPNVSPPSPRQNHLLAALPEGEMAETAVCNRDHKVDQQLCRWPLLSLDRLPSSELHMTQDLIANMLGVRREGVTEAAWRLQRAGLTHYSRGRITVLDRPGLEARVCECYEVVRKEFQRLLPEAPDPR